MNRIITHEDYREEPYLVVVRALYKGHRRVEPPELRQDALVGEAPARIELGRWIADCPAGCNNAFLVSKEQPFFLCNNCGAGWVRVVFPEDAREIETVLLARPWETARNWRPGETLEDLGMENRQHGLDGA